jgi:hypothetical protein
MRSAAERTAHNVTLSGGRWRDDRATFGTLLIPIAGAELTPGARLQCVLERRGDPTECLLQIGLGADPTAFGKRQSVQILVDGMEIVSQTEQQTGGGFLRSLFAPLPPGIGRLRVEVLCPKSAETSVIVSHLRIVERPMRHDPREQMPIALVSSLGMGYRIDAAEIRRLASLVPKSPLAAPQAAVLYNYCSRNLADHRSSIASFAAAAAETGIPLRIAPQTHWGGLPLDVSDGAGGRFGDIPYQQITFDPDDTLTEPGLEALMGDRWDPRFGLSTPNVWKRPWLTYNHPRLNELRRIRLLQALTAWSEAREALERQGRGALLPAEFSTGDETLYWAQGVDDSAMTALNGGRPRRALMADFNPFVVQDALSAGVALDPRDGLDAHERWWLHSNLAAQQQRIVQWMRSALTAPPILVREGHAQFSDDSVRHNIFTEPYGMPLFPMKETTSYRPGIELGYVRDGRPGAAWFSGSTMWRWLQRQREMGRTALPNLECTGSRDADDFAGAVAAAYASGARWVTLYNAHHATWFADGIQRAVQWLERPYGFSAPPAGSEPLTRTQTERTFTAARGQFGANRIELYPSEGSPVPPTFLVEIRSAHTPTESLICRVQPRRRELADSPYVLHLPTTFATTPGEQYIVRAATVDGASVKLRPAADGMPALRVVQDVGWERQLSLLVQDWRDAADILRDVEQQAARTPQISAVRDRIAEAKAQFSAGRPQAAYRTAVAAQQACLPAGFSVSAPGGRLNPYFVNLQFGEGTVYARMRLYDTRQCTLQLRSTIDQKAELTWGASRLSVRLTAGVPAEVSLPYLPAQPTRRTHPRRPPAERKTP